MSKSKNINILNFINKICITIEENSFIYNLFYLYYIILLIFFLLSKQFLNNYVIGFLVYNF